MNLFGPFRFAACLLLGLGLMAGILPQALAGNETPEDDVLARLSTLWQKQRERMQHGRFEALVVRLSPSDRQKMTVDEFNRLLTELDLKNVPAFMQKLLERFPAEPGVTRLAFAPIAVRVDGKRHIESWPVDATDSRKGSATRYNDGSVYVGYEPRNRQASIDQPTIAVLDIDAFRHLPIGPGAALIKQWQVAERKNGRVTLRFSTTSMLEEIEADEKTGFVFMHRHSWPTEKGTNLVFLQFGPVTHGAGRVLPGLNMEVFFKSGLVDSVSAHHVIKADMDTPVANGDFAVSVPAGTNVVDFRGDRTNPKIRSTREPVPDVLAFATAIR